PPSTSPLSLHDALPISQLAFGAGVVDGDVQAAEVLDDMLDQAAHFGLMAHVGTQVLGADAKGAQFGCQRLAGFVAAAGHNHARADRKSTRLNSSHVSTS